MDDPILTRLIERFAQAEACWFSSTRPDGRAHLAPIWHVWHEGRIYVVTQPQSVRAHNIAQQPAVSLSLPDPVNVMIVEGTARAVSEQAAALAPLFKAKYDWDYSEDNPYNLIIEVTPRKIMAWGGTDGEGRWHFDANGVRLLESNNI
ncbi:MAG: pyridoxamine 5'-phosphate oxidase family protein [Caldilineaceae bacterium]|nr:pyridoxamine 5'-phosphate oxidase family protein [Caldilineaceae bacterium]